MSSRVVFPTRAREPPRAAVSSFPLPLARALIPPRLQKPCASKKIKRGLPRQLHRRIGPKIEKYGCEIGRDRHRTCHAATAHSKWSHWIGMAQTAMSEILPMPPTRGRVATTSKTFASAPCASSRAPSSVCSASESNHMKIINVASKTYFPKQGVARVGFLLIFIRISIGIPDVFRRKSPPPGAQVLIHTIHTIQYTQYTQYPES